MAMGGEEVGLVIALDRCKDFELLHHLLRAVEKHVTGANRCGLAILYYTDGCIKILHSLEQI